jgi:hypothetical protein
MKKGKEREEGREREREKKGEGERALTRRVEGVVRKKGQTHIETNLKINNRDSTY